MTRVYRSLLRSRSFARGRLFAAVLRVRARAPAAPAAARRRRRHRRRPSSPSPTPDARAAVRQYELARHRPGRNGRARRGGRRVRRPIPKLYYVGAAGGGVWKSANGGQTWDPVFDKQASPRSAR